MIEIPKEIKSDRIILRPHKKEDLDPFINLMTDKRVTKTLSFSKEQKSAAGATELLNSVIDSYTSSNPIFALAIVSRLGKQYLGSCGLSSMDEYNTYECYYSLRYSYWGNGYAIEAMKALFSYAFNQLDLKKIKAYISPNNTRSWKVAERSGMMYLGQIPHSESNRRAMYYVITKRDFELQNYY